MNLDDLSQFDFALAPEQIAQHPPAERDGGRLLRLERKTGRVEHSEIRALPEPRPIENRLPLWSHWITVALTVLLLAVFWTGRKLNGNF